MFRKSNNMGESREALAKRGFSLVELLVVITIIAILSVAAYTAVGGQTIKAKNSRRMNDLSTIQTALEIYAVNNNNKYPVDISATYLTSQYISKIPVDPTTKQPYKYNSGAGDRSYQLGAHLEDETGGLADKAYVIGNGTGLLTAGKTYNATTGTCGDPACVVDDGDTDCVPYCL